MAEAYLDLAIKRQAILERIKSGQVRDFAREIQKIEKLIRNTLLGLDEELGDLSRRKLESLLSTLQKDQAVIFKAATQTFLNETSNIAALYMGQEIIDLTKTIDMRGTVLKDFTKKDLFSKVIKRPLSTDGDLLEPWIKDFTTKEITRTNKAVRRGWSQGKTNQEMVRELIGTKTAKFKDGILETSRRNASAIVRTSVQHAASAARQEVWEANRDVIDRYEFLATLDRATSSQCRSLDGQQFEFGKGPIPPIHPNCLLPGSLITASCGISSVFKRAYEGQAFRVKTRSGNEITITPNHPVLTQRGWVGAQFLNVGDKCFVNSTAKGVIGAKGHYDGIYARVEDIAKSFGGPFNVCPVEVPTTAPDFHGDGINHEVTNVRTYRYLGFVRYTPKVKHGGKSGFVMRGRSPLVFGSCLRAHTTLFKTSFSTPNSIMGFFCKLGSLFRSRKIHSGLLLGRPATQRNASTEQDTFDRAWADAEFLRDTSDTDASLIFTDDIVSVESFHFCGHVYNLDTENHIIESNGIVTHNCRSTTIPILSKEFDFLSKGRTRSAEFGPVSKETSYYDWLKRQSKEDQFDVLGESRGKLFREGGMSAERFRELQFDRNFEPLTLAEMRRLEPQAFERAGL
jgi:SPP1 gp7 family putative phage head morphogenesis protein